jgi:hypothetical protein
MKKKLIDALVFFRLVNGDGCISLSNIAVIVILAKMSTMPGIDLSSAAALLTALAAYNFKRYTVAKAKKVVSSAPDFAGDLADIRSELNKIKLAVGFNSGQSRSS